MQSAPCRSAQLMTTRPQTAGGAFTGRVLKQVGHAVEAKANNHDADVITPILGAFGG